LTTIVPIEICVRIIDDHSSDEFLLQLLSLASHHNISISIECIKNAGHNASLYARHNYAMEVAGGADLIYFIEDDYLHSEGSLLEAYQSYTMFKQNLGGAPVALSLQDDAWNYNQYRLASPCRVVRGSNRHWRTNVHTTGSFIVEGSTYLKYAHLYELFTHYDGNIITEENTINKVYREVMLFSPLPGLVQHMQFSDNISPFVPWQQWWANSHVALSSIVAQTTV